MQECKLKIRTFLAQHIRNADLKDDTDIFAGGYVNSLFAMQLIVFLENDFSIIIENDDLKLDNFRTVNALADLIERKKTSRSAAGIPAANAS